MNPNARFAVGIDLGTTNCVMAVINLSEGGRFPEIQTIPLLQRLSADEVGTAPNLPSFLFWPTESQRQQLPEFNFEAEGWVLGHGAAEMGRKVKGRLVSSAKSWLCHSRVNRNADLLPWGAEDGVEKISPLKATQLILEHLVYCWQKSDWGSHPISEQEVTVTLPASFDQTARSLTVEACQKAGLGHAKLLEEPQAAFYNWISLRKGRWSEALKGCDKVLVCDIGGGTSDFSLIDCHEEDGEMKFEREAVGDHLLLGGDNIDLALAHMAESRLSKGKSKNQLNLSQWQQLSQLTRRAKETLLGGEQETVTLRLPGAGRKVIGGLRTTELQQNETSDMVLKGFFPIMDANYKAQSNRGLQEMGLPYESEPAITWHIEDFIKRHPGSDRAQAILFNGGTLEPQIIRDRIIDSMAKLRDGAAPVVLESDSLAEAVARGAAYYGFASAKGGLRVGGGSSQGFYLEIQSENGLQHICALPKGSEPHEMAELAIEGLEVRANHPIQFQLFESDLHPLDEVGSLRQLSDSGKSPTRLSAMVRFGKQGERTVPVCINSELTELDTLVMELKSIHTTHRWKLEFDLRQSQSDEFAQGNKPMSEVPSTATSKTEIPDDLEEFVLGTFEGSQPASLIKALEKKVEVSRSEWDVSFLRAVADVLLAHPKTCQRSASHEASWNMGLGFCLRPGYGDPGDEGRRQKLWSAARNGGYYPKDNQSRSQWATLWRRVSTGLEDGRQSDLIQRQKKELTDKKGNPSFKGAGAELWRMICSMEIMGRKDKRKLGEILIKSLKEDKGLTEMKLWCLARLGTRQPFSAGAEHVLTSEEVSPWVEQLMGFSEWINVSLVSTIVEMSRLCGDRQLDLSEGLRQKVLDFLVELGEDTTSHSYELVLKGGQRNLSEQGQLLGESLPAGLSLKS